MAKIEVADKELIEAMKLWLGKGIKSFPDRDDGRVCSRFGEEKGDEIIKYMEALQSDFSKSEAWLKTSDLAEMAEISKKDFKQRHANIPPEITDILAWQYTYSYR